MALEIKIHALNKNKSVATKPSSAENCYNYKNDCSCSLRVKSIHLTAYVIE
jgi:hypothetical protein